MAYGVGVGLALLVSLFARVVGFDRDRAFYPTVLIVVGSYYVLFAVIGATSGTVWVEFTGMAVFVLAAVAGFRWNLWITAVALVGHGVFDFFHAGIVTNPGVPAFWPPFCMAYDVAAGLVLGWLLTRTGSVLPSIPV